MNFILDGFLKAFDLLWSHDLEVYAAIGTTLQVSTASLLMSLLAGIPCGFCLGYFDFAGKRALRLIVDTLLSLPTVFIGLVVYAFISHRGPLGEFGLLFSLPAIIIGQTILALPIVTALTAAAVESLDRRLRPTLAALGAGARQTLLTTIREAHTEILTAAVTAYGRVMTEVGISMMVGGNIKWHTRTITTAIALETGKGEFASGIALGLVLLLIALGANFSLFFLKRRWQD